MAMARVWAPENFRAAAGLRDQRLDHRLQARVLVVMQMIGLGCGKEDAVDAAAEDTAEKGVSSGPEGTQDGRHRLAQILQRLRPRMDRAQRIDQNDLPVDAREMGAEEGFDHLPLVGLVAAREFMGE